MTIKKKTVFCLSLGCAKNKVDGERFLGVLKHAGCDIVQEAEGADVCMINTCGFLRSAVEENIEAILDMIELKASGKTKRIGVVGCLVNRYAADLPENLPEVDFWARCEDYGAVLNAVNEDGQTLANRYPERSILPGNSTHTRYLKLSEGCDNRCTYCAIPNIRGGLKSLSTGFLVEEAARLVEEGAREICLVGQDLTAYGSDREDNGGLYDLLDALESSLPGDIWLRLLYLHPNRVDRRLLERVANGKQILPYLDIPIQHASSRVLERMNRGMDEEALLAIFKTARDIRPGFALRTTCMVGFPGEKKSDFETLTRFLSEVRFDRVGAFVFSAEEGTEASLFPEQVSPKTKRSRLEKLMSLQEEISLSRQGMFVGRELDVLIDAVSDDGTAEGRSFREAPEVDGMIEVEGSERLLKVGERIKAMITNAYEHDLTAKEVPG